MVFRKHYGLAIQIAKHLKLPESRILEHWAFYKVMYDNSKSSDMSILSVFFFVPFDFDFKSLYFFTDDDQVVKKIAEKLRLAGGHGISICNIAKKAGERNRKELAIRVIISFHIMPSYTKPILIIECFLFSSSCWI